MSADGLACVNEVAVRWAEVVVRAAWQGGVALLLVGIVCRAVPRLSADLRCWLWRLAFLKLLGALLWSAPVRLPLLPAPPAAAVDPPAASTALAASAISRPGGRDVGLPANSPSTSSLPWPSPMSGLLLLWLAGVTACGLGVAREWRAGRHLADACAPVTDRAVSICCAALSQRYGWGRPPRLLQAEGLASPMLLGAWRPAILLPSTLLAECSLAELELILAHELAHGKRRDLLWSWLPAVARALLFFHPLVWLAQQELRLAQEMACDAMAVRVTRAPAAAYGDLLLKVAARGGRPLHGGPVALGVIESYQTLARRLKAMRTLGCTSRPCHRIAAMLLGLTGLLGLVPWQLTAQSAPSPTPPDRQPPVPAVAGPKPRAPRPAGESMPAHPPGGISFTLPIDTDDPRKPRELGLSRDPFPRLLSYRSVQQELHLTPDQQKQMQPVMAEWEDAVGRMHYTLRGLRRAREVDAKTRARVQAILTADQERRLSQIDRQHRPPSALFWEDVGQDLDETPAQHEQLRAILREYEQTVARLATEVKHLQGQSPEIAPGKWGQPQTWEWYEIPAASTPQLVQAGEEAYAKAATVLTDAQRARWRELFGTRFFVRELPFTRTMKLPGPS